MQSIIMINLAREMQKSYQQVNWALNRYILTLSNQQEPLIQAIRCYSMMKGKRIRPFLVYQTGQLFGLMPASLDPPAAAIECIHAYSLIHDDLPAMDNDSLRRGHPACHIKFGETIAILAGDALQTLAFNILAKDAIPFVTLQDQLQMIDTLASASGANGMCLGQSLDLLEKEQHISITHLENIHLYKTASLIRAAVRMGALAAGKQGQKILSLLDQYATAIGIAFQVQDDIIDTIKDHKNTNKKYNKKQTWHKNTYTSLVGLDKARKKVKELYYASLTSLKYIARLGYNVTILSSLARYIIERDQ